MTSVEEIADLRKRLADDRRPTRDGNGMGGGKPTADAEKIRAERVAWKRQIRELEAELAVAAANAMPRARDLAMIEAEMAPLRSDVRAAKARLRELERERNEAVVAARVASMPDAERDALRRVLIGPSSIPSAEAVGTPKV